MPIAWLDEIAGLEPAINFLQGRGYTSKLWPYDGVDQQFLAYLPLQGWLHIVGQFLLPSTIYGVRLPYVIFLLAGTVFLYFTLRARQVSLLILLGVLALLLNEKSIFETTRGVRVEPIAFFLLQWAYWAYTVKKKHHLAAASAVMLILHPYLYPAALIFFIKAHSSHTTALNKAFLRPSIALLYPTAIVLGFLFFIHFDIALFVDQFSAQGRVHSNFGGFLTLFQNHFIKRFWPYYLTQPYIPLLIYSAILYSIYSIFRRTANTANYALLATHIVWLVALGPMHRYNSVLVVLSLFCFIPHLASMPKVFHWKQLVIASIVLAVSMLDVGIRQVMSTVQRSERDPTKFMSHINVNLPRGKSIITGQEIAYYASMNNPSLDFFLFNTTPYRFSFDAYDNLLILHYDTLAGFSELATYKAAQSTNWTWVKKSGTKTYDGVYLLVTKDVHHYKKTLALLKDKNTQARKEFKYQ